MGFCLAVLEGTLGNFLFYGIVIGVPLIALGFLAERWEADYQEDAYLRKEKIKIIIALGFFIGTIRVWIEKDEMYFNYFTIGIRRKDTNTGYYFGINNGETGAFIMFVVKTPTCYVGQYLIADSVRRQAISTIYEWKHD